MELPKKINSCVPDFLLPMAYPNLPIVAETANGAATTTTEKMFEKRILGREGLLLTIRIVAV